MPRAFTYGVGVLVALALVLASLVVTVWLDVDRTAERHDAGLRLFQRFTAEGTGLLERLLRNGKPQCHNEGLMDLNAHLLGSRYLREIGVLNEERGLICSTALGQLAVPIKGNYPVHVSRSGIELMNVPLTMAGKKVVATIIQRPPFNVVVNPFATDDLYASADVVWLRTADQLLQMHATVGPKTLAAMQERAGRVERTTLSRQGLGYELVSMAPEADVVLQTRRGLWAIVQHDRLLPALLVGSLLMAALLYGTITPFVVRLCSLRQRIGYLCHEEHLMLLYQPVFDLTTMRPIGCEVLARLKEGDTTWTPDKMIPAVLGAGLEQRFDHAVTRKAIRELAAHLPAWSGGRFSIALNYFPKSIRPDTLIPILTGALQATGRDDFEVCIEVTEHSLSSELIAEVQRLKAQGFLVAVDDFGTGYSNLKSVTQLAPDLLKIDGSFVYELEDATVRSNLIPQIVHIAQAVNAQTVAEGIEKMEQVQLLVAEGVRYGQGYALGRPMEIGAFRAFVEGYR